MRKHLIRGAALVATACIGSGAHAAASSADPLTCGGAPTNLTAPTLSPNHDQQTGTVLTLTRGNWQTGGCQTTYTYFIYHGGVQYTSGPMNASSSIQYTLSTADEGYTITAKVQACQDDCSLVAATGSATVRDITYSVWIDGTNKNINWQVKSPNGLTGLVETQPRNGICQTFDTAFSNFNAGFATDTSSTVALNSAMTVPNGSNYNPIALNGGEDGHNAPYPDASVSTGSTAWRSTMTTSNVSCPDGYPANKVFPGIGEEILGYPAGYAPLSVYGKMTRYSAGMISSPNGEIQLAQYWLDGNYACPTDLTNECDWIEVGTIVGTAQDGCGAPINNGSVYFYVEELKNQTSTSFDGNGSCTTSWNGSMSHWHQGDGTREFYIFGPASSYGTTHTFELRYVSG